jgi:hypothetical protein
MTNAADEAAAALKASMAINQGQQALTEESRLMLAALLRGEMRVAVAEGIEAVLTDEKVWAKVFMVLQQQATERTGQFVLGGITAIFKKALWIGTFALIAYSIGGWTLVKTIWAALIKGAP